MMNNGFPGSYLEDDCTFLLKPVTMTATDVAEKERLIQSGQKHYSEMISSENAPSPEYMQLFADAMERNQERFAADVAVLAGVLAMELRGTNRPEVVLVSLARAGTPVGVLLHRLLRHLGVASTHYSVSIIRDRGIDAVALDYILERHADRDLVFVDGWTGKGAITTELKATIAEYNKSREASVSDRLVTVADLAGVAGLAATNEDYLIPSSILNSIVSGLTSRSVLNDEYVGPDDFHACLYYDHLEEHDLSGWFVDTITPLAIAALADPAQHLSASAAESPELRQQSEQFIAQMMDLFDVADRNRVKPGIGESTRALLRRLPECLLLADPNHEDVAHLKNLAIEKSVPLFTVPAMPYKAAVIIKTLGEQ